MISILKDGKWLCILAAGLLSQGALAADFNFTGGLITTSAPSMDFTSGGITVTVTPSAGQVTQNGFGVGVNNGELGNGLQIGQSLTLTFSQAVTVGGIGFGNWNLTTLLSPNIADVSYNGTTQTFQSTSILGLFTCTTTGLTDCYDLGNAGPLTSLTVTPASDSAVATNFFVRELCDVTPVPLPGAVWLFGSGLIGLGAVKRCRCRQV